MKGATAAWTQVVLAASLVASRSLAAPASNTATAPEVPALPACLGCHGAHGEGTAANHAPRLAGQSAEYLQKQLEEYAAGTRDNAVMAAFSRTLTSQQRAQLAAHFAEMSAGAYVPADGPSPSAAQLSRGHELAYLGNEQRRVQACNGCHGPDGSGVLHATPYLAGQSAEYLAGAIKSFQTDTRRNDGG